jgi:hypothetical protein
MTTDMVAVRMATLPGQLRRGDFVMEPGRTTFVLTEMPKFSTVYYGGHACPVYYLTGRDIETGRPVKMTKSARCGVDASRDYALNGRKAPVFKPVEWTESRDSSLIY